MAFWNLEPVAREHQLCADLLFRAFHSGGEIGVVAQRHRVRLSVAHQECVGILLIDLALEEMNVLIKAVAPGRLEPRSL